MDNMTKMNPVCGIILLKSYCSPNVMIVSPAEEEAVDFLQRNNLITYDIKAFNEIELKISITEKGAALIKYWMETSLPVCVWTIPKTP